MSEHHLSEVEKTLLYISEARERAKRARTALAAAGAEPHLISALKETEQSLADDHRKLMQRTFFAIPDTAGSASPASPQRLGGPTGGPRRALARALGAEYRMAHERLP